MWQNCLADLATHFRELGLDKWIGSVIRLVEMSSGENLLGDYLGTMYFSFRCCGFESLSLGQKTTQKYTTKQVNLIEKQNSFQCGKI